MMHSKDMLIISIFTLITVMAWIAFDVYHAAVTSTVSQVQEKLITPLDPKLDTSVLNRVQQQ